MKRFALIILVCLLAFPDANAQAEWAPHRLPDEINVSYGRVSIPSFGFQVDPIAMEFGGMSFRGFVEAGIGMEGLVKAGVRYAL